MNSNNYREKSTAEPTSNQDKPSSRNQDIVKTSSSEGFDKQPSGKIKKSIADIIGHRKNLASRVTPVCDHLSHLRDEISGLNRLYKKLMAANDISADLESIKFDSIKIEIDRTVEELNRLKRRLSRSTLNVGVLGSMGQGKSTFLNSLSGLNFIPAFTGGACTAVRSKFLHHDGDLEVTVTFHSAETFLSQVIGEYYRVLGLGFSPDSLNSFENKPLPILPEKNSTTHQEMYRRLKDDYHANFSKYKKLIESGVFKEIKVTAKEDIKKYVSQERDVDTQLLTNCDHLAVREVEIRCPFPKDEFYGLGLIDVPGLGDTKIGDEKVILEALREEMDVVLLVRQPQIDRYQWDNDFKIYELAEAALGNLDKRCFIVLNHRDFGGESNREACDNLQKNTKSIKCIGSPMIANCSISTEVNGVLDQILDYLSKNIVEIEVQCALSCHNSLLKLYGEMSVELDKAQNALASYDSGSRQFESSFKEVICSLSVGLNHMLNELWSKYENIDDEFKKVVDAAIEECEENKGIPSKEEIKKLIHLPKNKNDYKIVYYNCAAELRSHLSKNFLMLDQGLQDSSDKLKCLVADTLIRGGLSGLANAKDVDFLETIRKMLSDRQNRLELGFRTLLDFKMSYGTLIMQSIRKNLEEVFGGVRANLSKGEIKDKIIIDEQQANTTSVATVDLDNEIAFVLESLNTLHRKAIDECKKTLEEWEKSPNQLRFYMAEEFIDKILYDKDIEEEWRHFLADDGIRSKVWIEFEQIEQRKQVQAEWLSAVRRVQSLNQRELLSIKLT